ncbi:MAG: hypothetical protein HUU25_12235 [Candidatus Sumerlaeia bacterium]|nr:hypothetical protein [Candidatus Sumerlaeia bacterium]
MGHRLHPVFHAIGSLPCNRVDKTLVLPADPGKEDLEEWLECLSEPPRFSERLCPVSAQLGSTTLRGKSLADLIVKGHRHFARMFTGISLYVHQTVRSNFGEPGMVPFMSLSFDPDLWERLINADYDEGETTHATFMELIRRGVVSPCITIPFGVLLPTLESDFDVRMLCRIALFHSWHLLEAHHEHIERVHGESRFVAALWLPEGGFSRRVVRIFHEEFTARAAAEGKTEPHLVLLLDNHQVVSRDNDRLMKSWNMMRLDENSGEYISILFRDRGFSEWVSYSSPSVKKLLDRTIAKVDAELNSRGVDYCWSHFEELETLFLSSKAAMNFEQKLTKLTELGYLPVSPDAFVRRKLEGKYGLAEDEPRRVDPCDGTAWAGWVGENGSAHLGRWLGMRDREGEGYHVEPSRRVKRPTPEGEVEERQPQCWKVALHSVLEHVTRQVRGNAETLEGGVLGVLRSLVKTKNARQARQNIEAFLEHWALCHWSEHFIQHTRSEAEINIPDLIKEHLLAGCRGTLSEEEMLQAAVAAQAYYFALDARRASAFSWESLDSRGPYQASLMASLALINMIYVHRWRGDRRQEEACHEMLREELINFQQAHGKLGLDRIGVRESDWKHAMRSAIPESKDNVVRRAALRCAARHLRPLGHRCSANDVHLTPSVGHLWTAEVLPGNFRWDNPRYCGVPED